MIDIIFWHSARYVLNSTRLYVCFWSIVISESSLSYTATDHLRFQAGRAETLQSCTKEKKKSTFCSALIKKAAVLCLTFKGGTNETVCCCVKRLKKRLMTMPMDLMWAHHNNYDNNDIIYNLTYCYMNKTGHNVFFLVSIIGHWHARLTMINGHWHACFFTYVLSSQSHGFVPSPVRHRARRCVKLTRTHAHLEWKDFSKLFFDLFSLVRLCLVDS